jgi:hypothetical protein
MEEKRLTSQEWRDHIKADEDFQNRMSHVLFGNKEMEEIGLIQMNKEMYDILISAKNVKGFFGNIGEIGKWVLIIVGIIAAVKTLVPSLIAWFAQK